MNTLHKYLQFAARADRLGIAVTRIAIIIVLVWIGGLKFYKYEADGIVPFVANSPFMSFFYKYPAPDYKAHVNPEGKYSPENRAWHEQNRTYPFAESLGAVIVLLGLMLCLHPWRPDIAALGALLVVIMSFTTLSFLITTPESWVPTLGDSEHGFPYLSGRGRLVIKDIIMLGGAIVVMADSAKAYLAAAALRASKSAA